MKYILTPIRHNMGATGIVVDAQEQLDLWKPLGKAFGARTIHAPIGRVGHVRLVITTSATRFVPQMNSIPAGWHGF